MGYGKHKHTLRRGNAVSEPRPLATPEQVGTYLGVPIKTLYEWSYRGAGPRVMKVGRHLRYRWADVESWLDQRGPGTGLDT